MRLIRVIRDEIGGVNVWNRGSRKGCECSQRRSGRIRDSFENRLPQAFVVLATSDYAWDTVRRNQLPMARMALQRVLPKPALSLRAHNLLGLARLSIVVVIA